ncbi:MAG: oxygen-dependent coproporphyrinogen oxidase [Acidimicrobiia bacterium]
MNRNDIEQWYRGFQDRFCVGMETLDGEGVFLSDEWDRPAGGGGVTRILANGRHIERAAVNFSAVWGETPPGLSERMAAAAEGFYATGVSIIVHPRNPHAPTFHANVRYFETDGGAAWFGGGADLTPYYLFEDDARHFHRVLRQACDRHTIADHTGWKRACDDYFHLAHRGEARGIGGLFFDHLTDQLEAVWDFQRDLADHLLTAYLPILEHRIDTPFGPEQVAWHELRRGRYVEFNLVWDRGTRFGIETGGRTESILGSMPPRARWEYDHHPQPGTPEADLLAVVAGPARDWL